MRNISAIKHGLRNQHGVMEGGDWQIHIEGACGEMALAKALGLYWNGSVNTFKMGGDVGNFQVRTRSQHNYELLIRPDDPTDVIWWLVTGKAPRYIVQGWIQGIDAKHPDWLRAHGGRPPAYFVPHNKLVLVWPSAL